MISTPRCGQPVEYYELSRPADEFDPPDAIDPFPVCWRPKDHPNPARHMSRRAYLRALALTGIRKRAGRRNDSAG
jgi:hypothetical protein